MPDLCRECQKEALPNMSVCKYHKDYERKRSAKRRLLKKTLKQCSYLSCRSTKLITNAMCITHNQLYKDYGKQYRKRIALRNMFARIQCA